jgi:alkanesulfonate monooxygenase SsuD/methylene tetrahydromethanopterin reductase-like flavin-dependent oxidoreductase (luciferase family)
MKFHIFMLPTIGRRPELEAGMAGTRDDLYQRMLHEISEQSRFAEELGYYGVGFTEHHFHIEGFELSTNPLMLDAYVAARTERIKLGQLALVLPTHHPLRVAEDVAVLDQMTKGRMYVGFARGYQARWVNTLGQPLGVGATSSDKSDQDARNRAAFEEAWQIIKRAWTSGTFSYDGQFWKVPPPETAWDMPPTQQWGQGADPDGTLREIGIVPKPYQKPYPDVYAPFTYSATTARFWAREGGTPVVLSDDVEFCQALFGAYHNEARTAGRDLKLGQGIAMGATLCIGETEEQARELRELFDWVFSTWFGAFGFPPGLVLQGTPARVVEQLKELHGALNFEELFLWLNTGLYDHQVMMRQLELFATKVMPRFE